MRLRTLVIGAGLAGALSLGYWLGAHRGERLSAPNSNGPVAAAPTASAGADRALQSNPAAAKLVEEARAKHFTEFHTVQEILTLPSAFARREALYAIAGRADSTELGALITEAKKLSNAAERDAALDVLYLRYVEHDPLTALQSALALPDSEARNDSLRRVGAAWARIAPQAAFQQAGLEADPATRTILRDAIVRAWASQDAAAAFVNVAALPAGVQREQLLQSTTKELARQDPQRAVDLVGKLKASDSDRLLPVLASEWAHNDLRAAAQWIESQPRQRIGMLGYYIAPAYVAQFPAEALEWATRVDRSRIGESGPSPWGDWRTRIPDTALQLAYWGRRTPGAVI